MTTKPPLLIVEDDEDVRTQMKWALSADYDVVVAEDRAGATLAFRKHKPIVTLLDLGLPPRPNDPVEGMATLSSLLATDGTAKVIVISGQGERENALHAVGSGAYDFLQKPVDLDQLKFVVSRCAYVAGLEQEYAAVKEGRIIRKRISAVDLELGDRGGQERRWKSLESLGIDPIAVDFPIPSSRSDRRNILRKANVSGDRRGRDTKLETGKSMTMNRLRLTVEPHPLTEDRGPEPAT